MYDVQLCTYVVHARYIPVTSDLRMRNRHVEVAYIRGDTSFVITYSYCCLFRHILDNYNFDLASIISNSIIASITLQPSYPDFNCCL